jgi:uncharacterized membrane protein YkoI
MASARPAFAALAVLACVLTLAPSRAQELAQDAAPDAVHAAPQHACLDQKERRAEAETGRLIRLSAAMHAARSKMPGTVIGARLCHGQSAGQDGLVYLLTVLAHDGKVARITIDATSGVLVGER